MELLKTIDALLLTDSQLLWKYGSTGTKRQARWTHIQCRKRLSSSGVKVQVVYTFRKHTSASTVSGLTRGALMMTRTMNLHYSSRTTAAYPSTPIAGFVSFSAPTVTEEILLARLETHTNTKLTPIAGEQLW